MGRRKTMRSGGAASVQASARARSEWASSLPLFSESTSVQHNSLKAECGQAENKVAPTDVNAARGNGNGIVVDALAKLPERAVLDETALADALRVSKRTLRRMVARFELPPPVRLAGRSTWLVGKVLSWFEARAERASREAERMARRFDGMK